MSTVYCTKIVLNCKIDDLLLQIAEWYSEKTKKNIYPNWLFDTSTKITNSLHLFALSTRKKGLGYPELFSIISTETDNSVRGRQWITEIGIHQSKEDNPVHFSILVKVEDRSIRTPQVKNVTTPRIIGRLMRTCNPIIGTPGKSIHTLQDNSEAESFACINQDIERRFPIILISEKERLEESESQYLVNIERLGIFLQSIADVIIQPNYIDRRILAKLAAKDGGINIIWPLKSDEGEPGIKRFYPEDLVNLDDPEFELLTIIAQGTNPYYFKQHLHPSNVRQELFKREIEIITEGGKQSNNIQQQITLYREYVDSLESDFSEIQGLVEILESDIDQYKNEIQLLSDSNHLKDHKIEQLQVILDNRPTTSCLSDENRDALRLLLESKDNLTIIQSLKVIQELFPERVVVLPSAIDTAFESEFLFKGRFLNLLYKFVTDYWQDLANGLGDTQAKRHLGSHYSPNEGGKSDKRSTINRRTFTYQGEKITMLKHLKFGKDHGCVNTIRVHFDWISKEKRLVIGYVGPHIDF